MRMPKFLDRKSTRLNSSHLVISYAVFCLKKQSSQPQAHLRRSLAKDLIQSRYLVRSPYSEPNTPKVLTPWKALMKVAICNGVHFARSDPLTAYLVTSFK